MWWYYISKYVCVTAIISIMSKPRYVNRSNDRPSKAMGHCTQTRRGKKCPYVVQVQDILSHWQFQIKTHTSNHKQLPGQRGQPSFLPQIRVSVALCVLCQQQLALLSHPSVILSPPELRVVPLARNSPLNHVILSWLRLSWAGMSQIPCCKKSINQGKYEAYQQKTFMNSITLQPLDAYQVLMPLIKAIKKYRLWCPIWP